MAARLKKPGYGLNDAYCKWWNVVDKSLAGYGLVPTRADRCTYILYGSRQTRVRTSGIKENRNRMSDGLTTLDAALEYLMDPIARNNSDGREVHGIVCFHVDDLYMAGDKHFEPRTLANLRKDFSVGCEDKDDIMFVGRRIKWKTHDKRGPYISVDQKLAVDAVEEIKIEKHLKDNLARDPKMHTAYRSVLGQLNWLQSRTQVSLCYKFSRVVCR